MKNKLFIPDTSHLVDKTLEDVKKEIEEKYIGKGYRYPTEEEWKDLDKPKDDNWYYNFGSLVRRSVGLWFVPCESWSGSGWDRGGDWLDGSWNADYRVVLLETSDNIQKSTMDIVKDVFNKNITSLEEKIEDIKLLSKIYEHKESNHLIEIGSDDSITIKDKYGKNKDFKFIGSKREVVKMIGELLIKYSELK